MEGLTRKRDFREKRKSGEVYCLGVWGPTPENFGIFELPRLDFLQFQHDFRSFSDNKGLLLGGGGQNPSVEGPTQGQGGGGFGPSSMYVKRGPVIFFVILCLPKILKQSCISIGNKLQYVASVGSG